MEMENDKRFFIEDGGADGTIIRKKNSYGAMLCHGCAIYNRKITRKKVFCRYNLCIDVILLCFVINFFFYFHLYHYFFHISWNV